MWKAAVGHNVSVASNTESDDWETDPDFVNDISEEEQRWGAKTIEGSGRPQHIDINTLRSSVSKEHEQLKKKELQDSPKASYGYGGQFGTEKDRMDKSALGHDYKADLEKHSSQTDAAKGFGGKYGVQKERCDKSAVGFDYKAQIQQHSSQQDHSKGFGGRYGVQTDRVDKSAVGFEYKAQVQQHSSQQDYSQGFGGKFGVQKDRQDKAAHSWSHKEEIQKHQSQTDYAKGFGGRYGVQSDRVDKSAAGFSEIESPSSAYEKTQPLEAMTSGAQNLRSRFENMAKTAEEENRQKAEEERLRRQKRDKMERQENFKKETPQISQLDEPVSIPVPTPRGVQSFPQIAKEEDPEHNTPPIVPPKLPELIMTTESTHNEMWKEEQTYEDILEAPAVTEDLYEAIPDPPPRFSEEDDDNEDYDTILDPPAAPDEDDDIYDDLTTQDELPEQGPFTHMNQAGASGISAIALYDYEGGGDDEISFQPQDLITDIEMLDEGWWTGSCRGQRGLFPANYVEILQ